MAIPQPPISAVEVLMTLPKKSQVIFSIISCVRGILQPRVLRTPDRKISIHPFDKTNESTVELTTHQDLAK
jgi:hypothetical protein